MELLFFVVLVVAIASCSAVSIETEWKQWKEEHGKTYLSGKEEFQKKITWARNANFIKEFNQGEHRYSLAMNHLSDVVSPILLCQMVALSANCLHLVS